MTPLHLLCTNKAQRGNLISVVQFLIQKRVDVTLKDSNRVTALDVLRIIWKRDIDPSLVKFLGGRAIQNDVKNAFARLLLVYDFDIADTDLN